MESNGYRLTPAAIAAFDRGDFANAVIAAMPGGIEQQEAAGQRAFVKSETLPKDCDAETRKTLESAGVIFGDPVDDLFVRVMLPTGWHKEATNHAMHNKLLDEKSRVRATIFYKAAFYDRSANIHICRRFRPSHEPEGGWEKYDNCAAESAWVAAVRDSNDILIWKSEPVTMNKDARYRSALSDKQYTQADAWLTENYPDWRNPLAYWD
jgi:hypothetical protein